MMHTCKKVQFLPSDIPLNVVSSLSHSILLFMFMMRIHYCRSVHCVKMPDSVELESALAVMRECVELTFMLHGKVYTN